MTEFKRAEVSFRLWTTIPLLWPPSFLPGLPSTNIELGYHKSIITTGNKNKSAELIFIPFVNAWLFIMAQYQSSGSPGHHRVLGRFPPPKESNTSERGKVWKSSSDSDVLIFLPTNTDIVLDGYLIFKVLCIGIKLEHSTAVSFIQHNNPCWLLFKISCLLFSSQLWNDPYSQFFILSDTALQSDVFGWKL